MSTGQIAAVLGGRKVLRRSITSAMQMAELVAQGLPKESAFHLQGLLALNDQRLSKSLGVSAKTLGRLRKSAGGQLSSLQSDRVYRLARVFGLATDVFEDQGAAREWLLSAQVGLGNRIPIELMQSEAGAREVEDLLLRIEYGVFS